MTMPRDHRGKKIFKIVALNILENVAASVLLRRDA